MLACFLQMNSLDVYCLSHSEDKQYYARMVEVALTLDRKDFLPDGYPVDEEVYPRVPPKPAGRKGKAPASSSQVEEETAEDEEQEMILMLRRMMMLSTSAMTKLELLMEASPP